MLKRIVIVSLIILVVIAISYRVYVEIEKNKSKQRGGMPPTVVEVATVKQQEWYDQIKATGTMSAFQGIMVKSEASGRVTQIYFQDGTYTEAGQPIIQIYPDILQAQLQSDKASLKLAQLDYERGVELYKKRVISRQQLDTLTSTLSQNEAQVSKVEAQLVQHNITAPFSGMLGLRLVDIGSQVTTGQDLVQLQQINPIRVQFTVPEVYLSKLALDQTVEIKPSNAPNKTHKGVVYAFDSGVDPNNRSLAVRARVPNENRELIPGTFVEVTLYAGNKHPVLTVPQTAIEYSTEGLYVYKVVNNKAEKTTITLGVRKGDSVEITSGLVQGDIVITAGQVKLVDDAPVIVRPSKGAQTPTAEPPAKSDAKPTTTKNQNETNNSKVPATNSK